MKTLQLLGPPSLWAAGGLLGLAVLVLALVVCPSRRRGRERRGADPPLGGWGARAVRQVRPGTGAVTAGAHRDPGVRTVAAALSVQLHRSPGRLQIGAFRASPRFGAPGTDFPDATAGWVLPVETRDYQNWELKPRTVYYLAPGVHHGSFSASEGDVFVGGFAGGVGSTLDGDVQAAGRDRQQHHHRRAAERHDRAT